MGLQLIALVLTEFSAYNSSGFQGVLPRRRVGAYANYRFSSQRAFASWGNAVEI
jgi:hypothetical protein